MAHTNRMTDEGSVYLVVGKVKGSLNKGRGSPKGLRTSRKSSPP